MLILTLGNLPFFSTEFIKLVDAFAKVFLFTVVVVVLFFADLLDFVAVLVVLFVFVTFVALVLIAVLKVVVLLLKLLDKVDLITLFPLSMSSAVSMSERLCELTLPMLKIITVNKTKNIILFLMITPHFS